MEKEPTHRDNKGGGQSMLRKDTSRTYWAKERNGHEEMGLPTMWGRILLVIE